MVANVDHGDTAILNCQTWLAENYERADIVTELARQSVLPKRTFDRRFRRPPAIRRWPISRRCPSRGDKLGLYRALAGAALTSAALAEKTNTVEPYLREWLSAQAASGFVRYDAGAETFTLSPEQAAVLADGESPVNMTGDFYSLAAVFVDEPKLTQVFQDGQGGRLGRALQLSVLRGGAFLPPWLQGRFWLPSGCPRSTASSPSSSTVPEWPMSVAVTAPRPSLWPRPSRTPSSSAPTSMRASISSPCSMRCTIWVIRWAPPRMR
jgi:hypothetical protein